MTTQATTQDPIPTLERMIKAQLAWHQLCWQLPMACCGAGWLTRQDVKPGCATAPIAKHDQLAIPPEIDGDHALFA